MRHMHLRELSYALVFLVFLVVIYVGAYYSLVEGRRAIDVITDREAKTRICLLVTDYKIDGASLAEIFAPVNAVDLRFRFPDGRVDEQGFRLIFVSTSLPAQTAK
jgi:hypothetical protein